MFHFATAIKDEDLEHQCIKFLLYTQETHQPDALKLIQEASQVKPNLSEKLAQVKQQYTVKFIGKNIHINYKKLKEDARQAIERLKPTIVRLKCASQN